MGVSGAQGCVIFTDCCCHHTLPLATLTPLIARSLILKRLALFGNGPNIVKNLQSLIDRSSLVAGAGGLAPVALLVRLLALRPVDVGVGPASHVSILYNIVKPCLHVSLNTITGVYL